MKQQTLTVRVNTPLTPQVWRMVLEGDTQDSFSTCSLTGSISGGPSPSTTGMTQA